MAGTGLKMVIFDPILTPKRGYKGGKSSKIVDFWRFLAQKSIFYTFFDPKSVKNHGFRSIFDQKWPFLGVFRPKMTIFRGGRGGVQGFFKKNQKQYSVVLSRDTPPLFFSPITFPPNSYGDGSRPITKFGISP